MPRRYKRSGAVISLALLTGLALLLLAGRDSGSPAPAAAQASGPAAPVAVIARGRIEPVARVHVVSGPSFGGTIAELRVKEGQRVRRGDILAILDTYDTRAASVIVAEKSFALAELELQQVRWGAKQADIEAQKALVAMRAAEMKRAERQVERGRSLVAREIISDDTNELRSLELQRARENLRQAEASLRALTEVRAIDVQIAMASIELAAAQLARARIERDQDIIRAPIDGTILALTARPGAAIDAEGVLRMADTDELMVVAEIDAADSPLIRLGQPVTISSDVLAAPVTGKIARIANHIYRSERPTTDVLAGRDARIVEAEIEVDPPKALPALIGAEMTLRIHLNGS